MSDLDPSLRTLQFEVRSLREKFGEIEDRRKSQQQLHDDLRELSEAVKDLRDITERCHEALFAENQKGMFGQVGLFRQWVTNRRVLIVMLTVIPSVVASVFSLAVWAIRSGLLK